MKIGLIFSGYDSQFVGMAKDLYDENRLVQDYFEEAYNCLNINFVNLCFASSNQELSTIQNSYLSLFLVNTSFFNLLKENGVQPSLVTGYGLPGLYSAIYAAKGFTFPDGLYLLKKIANFYEENLLNIENLTTIKVEEIPFSKLKKLCLEYNLNIVAINSKEEFIVNGLKNDIENFKEQKNKLKFKCKNINFETGIYSNLIESVKEQFKIYLEKVDFKDLQIPMISNIDGKEILKNKKVEDNIVKQITSSINWEKVISKFNDMDCIIEIGPKEVYASKLKEIYPEKQIVSFNKKSDLEVVRNLINNNVNLNAEVVKPVETSVESI